MAAPMCLISTRKAPLICRKTMKSVRFPIFYKSLSAQIEPNVNVSKTENETQALTAKTDPLKHVDFFEVRNFFTVRDLFESRVHWGHKEGSLNDHMRPFIFGSRLGHLIFDLDQTAHHLRAALNFTAHLAFRKGVIMFVNRNQHTSHIVEKTAKECGEYAHTRRWQDDVLTNAHVQFGAVTRLPDLVIFMSVLSSILDLHLAVSAAAKMLIPTVGIVDSNADPTLVTYPVPGNDDTPIAVQFYCDLFKKAILVGKQKRKEYEEQGLLTD